MIFSTALFLFRFLPITLALYYLAPAKLKNTVLFLCSLVFYSWGEVKLFPVMVVLILINYVSGLFMEKFADNSSMRRAFLLFSIIGSLGMLFFFKYTDFFISNINNLLGLSMPLLELTLPLGISFYTFQTMSYSIDVYRGDVPCEHNIIDFGAYVVMFPQLIAGPIVKYRDVSDRLHILKGRVTLDRVNEGIPLFIFGLAKKVLLADGISALWYDIIGRYADGKLDVAGIGLVNASTPLVWLGLIAYTMQIYFDFSGYSMMGIGMGKMLGFDFPDNFNLPYISRSITEFWRRWHITLSSWFKEYVYIPLGGNRKGMKRQLFNIFIVWFLTGFWHGANWNFILWGMYYFVLLMIEKLFLLPKLEKGKIWPHIYTMFFVIVGWALFVAGDNGVEFGLLFTKLFIPSSGVSALYFLRNYGVLLIVGILCCTKIPMKLYEKVKENELIRGLILAIIFTVTIAYMVDATNSPFLYFRF
ncbi:MAG: MBOAT family O-acyltransferase [Oscillospiraceae bacterium]